MSSYPSNSKDVRLEELESNVNPGSEAVLAIIQELDLSQIKLTEESRAAFKTFEKSLEYRRLRKIFMYKLATYSAGEQKLEDVRQSNTTFKAKETARRKVAGDNTPYKIQENKDTTAEGRTSIFSCAKRKHVVVQFTSQIKDELFKSSIVAYSFKTQMVTLLIQSFFNFIETAKDLGIPRSKLGQVLNIFCRLCLPSLTDQMNTEVSCLVGNMERLLEHISIKAERKKMELHLDQIVRHPGEPLENYSHLLFTLYNSFATLDYIVENKENEEEYSEMASNPTQISRYKAVDDKVQILLRKALRSLCSPSAQKNITDLVRKKKTVMPTEVMKEAVYKCDAAHPLMQAAKLPSSLVFISSNDSVDYNPPLEVMQGAFGYFGQRPPSPGCPPSPGQGSSYRPPSWQQSPSRSQRQSPGPGQRSSRPTQRQSGGYTPQQSYGAYARPPSPQQPFSGRQYQRPPQGDQSPRRGFSPWRQNSLSDRQRTGYTPKLQKSGYQKDKQSNQPSYNKSPAPPPPVQAQKPPASSPAHGSPGRPAAPPGQPSNSPRQPSRSPSNDRGCSFYLDNVSFDQIKYQKGFCVKCGDNSHTHEKCNVYKGFLKNRCYLCKLFHSTFLCKNALQQKSKSVFENKAAKN